MNCVFCSCILERRKPQNTEEMNTDVSPTPSPRTNQNDGRNPLVTCRVSPIGNRIAQSPSVFFSPEAQEINPYATLEAVGWLNTRSPRPEMMLWRTSEVPDFSQPQCLAHPRGVAPIVEYSLVPYNSQTDSSSGNLLNAHDQARWHEHRRNNYRDTSIISQVYSDTHQIGSREGFQIDAAPENKRKKHRSKHNNEKKIPIKEYAETKDNWEEPVKQGAEVSKHSKKSKKKGIPVEQSISLEPKKKRKLRFNFGHSSKEDKLSSTTENPKNTYTNYCLDKAQQENSLFLTAEEQEKSLGSNDNESKDSRKKKTTQKTKTYNTSDKKLVKRGNMLVIDLNTLEICEDLQSNLKENIKESTQKGKPITKKNEASMQSTTDNEPNIEHVTNKYLKYEPSSLRKTMDELTQIGAFTDLKNRQEIVYYASKDALVHESTQTDFPAFIRSYVVNAETQTTPHGKDSRDENNGNTVLAICDDFKIFKRSFDNSLDSTCLSPSEEFVTAKSSSEQLLPLSKNERKQDNLVLNDQSAETIFSWHQVKDKASSASSLLPFANMQEDMCERSIMPIKSQSFNEFEQLLSSKFDNSDKPTLSWISTSEANLINPEQKIVLYMDEHDATQNRATSNDPHEYSAYTPNINVLNERFINYNTSIHSSLSGIILSTLSGCESDEAMDGNATENIFKAETQKFKESFFMDDSSDESIKTAIIKVENKKCPLIDNEDIESLSKSIPIHSNKNGMEVETEYTQEKPCNSYRQNTNEPAELVNIANDAYDALDLQKTLQIPTQNDQRAAWNELQLYFQSLSPMELVNHLFVPRSLVIGGDEYVSNYLQGSTSPNPFEEILAKKKLNQPSTSKPFTESLLQNTSACLEQEKILNTSIQDITMTETSSTVETSFLSNTPKSEHGKIHVEDQNFEKYVSIHSETNVVAATTAIKECQIFQKEKKDLIDPLREINKSQHQFQNFSTSPAKTKKQLEQKATDYTPSNSQIQIFDQEERNLVKSRKKRRFSVAIQTNHIEMKDKLVQTAWYDTASNRRKCHSDIFLTKHLERDSMAMRQQISFDNRLFPERNQNNTMLAQVEMIHMKLDPWNLGTFWHGLFVICVIVFFALLTAFLTIWFQFN